MKNAIVAGVLMADLKHQHVSQRHGQRWRRLGRVGRWSGVRAGERSDGGARRGGVRFRKRPGLNT